MQIQIQKRNLPVSFARVRPSVKLGQGVIDLVSKFAQSKSNTHKKQTTNVNT